MLYFYFITLFFALVLESVYVKCTNSCHTLILYITFYIVDGIAPGHLMYALLTLSVSKEIISKLNSCLQIQGM